MFNNGFGVFWTNCRGAKVRKYNFNESKSGKGVCNRSIATKNSLIRRCVNQGCDILVSSDLCRALREVGGVRDLDEVIEFQAVANLQILLPKMNNLIVLIGRYLNFDYYMKRMIMLVRLLESQ